ncbi:MAG: hypothetical protein R2734_14330 [Nocardioides sp.]
MTNREPKETASAASGDGMAIADTKASRAAARALLESIANDPEALLAATREVEQGSPPASAPSLYPPVAEAAPEVSYTPPPLSADPRGAVDYTPPTYQPTYQPEPTPIVPSNVEPSSAMPRYEHVSAPVEHPLPPSATYQPGYEPAYTPIEPSNVVPSSEPPRFEHISAPVEDLPRPSRLPPTRRARTPPPSRPGTPTTRPPRGAGGRGAAGASRGWQASRERRARLDAPERARDPAG